MTSKNLLLFALFIIFQSGYSQIQFQGYNCSKLEVDKDLELAYIGWPFAVECTNFFVRSQSRTIDFYNYEDYPEDEKANCLILDLNGTVLLNFTSTTEQMLFEAIEDSLALPKLSLDSNVDFQLYLIFPQKQKCLFLKVHLKLIPFKSESCQKFVNTTSKGHPVYLGSFRRLRCEVPVNLYPKVYDDGNVEYQWLRNCSSLPQNTTLSSKNSTLTIKHIEYADAGIYTCSVTYNGMRRYISLLPVCVSGNPSFGKDFSLSCLKTGKKSTVGGKAQFDCKGDFNGKHVVELSFKFFWYKKGQRNKRAICKSKNEAKKRSSDISCIYEYERKCHLNVPTEKELSKDNGIVPVRLYFKNIKREDFGEYVLECSINVEKSKLVRIILKLEEDNSSSFSRTILLVAILVFLFILLLVFMGIAVCFPIHFRAYYKRYCGAYDSDNCKYGAFLVYNHSSENDRFIQKETCEAAKEVRRLLEDMGYSVFDPNKDGNFGQSCVEKDREAIKSSHRVVIILTEQFMNDDFNMSTFYKGFESMILSKSKLIFILLPGVQQYVWQKAKTEPACKVIQSAIIHNNDILWQNIESKSKQLILQLEYAMPKLKPKASFAEEFSPKIERPVSL